MSTIAECLANEEAETTAAIGRLMLHRNYVQFLRASLTADGGLPPELEEAVAGMVASLHNSKSSREQSASAELGLFVVPGQMPVFPRKPEKEWELSGCENGCKRHECRCSDTPPGFSTGM